MIDIHSESLLSIREAAQTLPNRPHIATLWRWVQRGCRGIRLETVLIGGQRFTSKEALQRFADQTTASADGTLPSSSTPSTRRRSHERACRELDGAGIQ